MGARCKHIRKLATRGEIICIPDLKSLHPPMRATQLVQDEAVAPASLSSFTVPATRRTAKHELAIHTPSYAAPLRTISQTYFPIPFLK